MPRSALVALIVILPTAAAAQTTAAVLDSSFASLKTTTGPGCTVGIDLRGVRTTRAYGMANLEYAIPLKPESIVESGSVAKQFTAAAVALLAQQGKLSLDDDIRKYLPEVPDFGTPITIRNLLNHTSGLRDQWGLLSLENLGPGHEVHTLPRILDLISHQQRLNFAPGSEYLYSNTGYVLSAIIIQRVTGKPFWKFSKDALFDPMGMTRTEWRADYRKVVPDRATAYTREPSGWVQDMPFTMVHGNGGLLTTVGDLLIWNEALTRGTIPGGRDLVTMLETQGTLTDGTRISYGLGLVIGSFRGIRSVSHNGATAGYRTVLSRYPDRGLSIALLCNAGTVDPTALSNRIAATLLGLPADEPPPGANVAISADDLEAFAGRYRDSTTDQTTAFAVTNGALTASVVTNGGLNASVGGPPAPLTHLGHGLFWSPGGEYRFEKAGDHWEVIQTKDGTHRFAPVRPIDEAAMRDADFAGEYRSAELDVTVKVVTENGASVLRLRPDLSMKLTPIYQDGFEAGGRTVRFTRDSAGNVSGLRIFAARIRDVRFEKIESAAVPDRR